MRPFIKSNKAFGVERGFGVLRQTLPFLAVIAVQAVLAIGSVQLLSSVRAYVAGESLWLKGQKDAIHYLGVYAVTRDEDDFVRYRAALAVPLADRAARRALEKTPPNLAAARAGFLIGGNDAADIPGVIRLTLYARWAPFFAEAFEKWRAADALLDEFEDMGEATREEVSPTAALARIEEVNQRTMPLARAFSDALGAGSRKVAGTIAIANLVVGGLLYILIVWRTSAYARQRGQIARALEVERERAAMTLEEIGEAVLRIDADGRLRYANPAAHALIGLGGDALGQSLTETLRLVDADNAEVPDLAAAILTSEAPRGRRSGLTLLRADARVPVVLAYARVNDEQGGAGAVVVLHDRSQEQEMIERLAYQATHDPLTGLANRREFERALREALAHGSCAVALADLDRFKDINDTGGHAAGDALLRHVAARLASCARPGDLVARLGGDEFGVLLRGCDPDRAREMVEAMRAALHSAAFPWDGRRYGVTASFGAAAVPPGAHELEAVLRAADAACYRAKAGGRNRTEVAGLAA